MTLVTGPTGGNKLEASSCVDEGSGREAAGVRRTSKGPVRLAAASPESRPALMVNRANRAKWLRVAGLRRSSTALGLTRERSRVGSPAASPASDLPWLVRLYVYDAIRRPIRRALHPPTSARARLARSPSPDAAPGSAFRAVAAALRSHPFAGGRDRGDDRDAGPGHSLHRQHESDRLDQASGVDAEPGHRAAIAHSISHDRCR
jgi:hypothetical protein